MRFETMAIHAGDRPDVTTGAISVPIYQTSTFVFEDVGKTRGWDYSRTANPTRKVLEDTIAQLEGGQASFAFATGMAAETTVMHLLKTGDHVISGDDVYGGTYRLFQDVMTALGLEFTFLRMDNKEMIEEATKPNTKTLWLETTSNPPSLRRLKVFSLAESLGGITSLAEHPATMSHASMPKDYRVEVGITDELIRLSVGLENVDDLTEDLEQALESL